MANKVFKSIKENSSIILIFIILLSILFRISGFIIASEILLWANYTLLALFFISFFIQSNAKKIEIPGKIILIVIPFLPLLKFMDAFLVKAVMSLSVVIVYLISSNKILWLNKKNWQYSFLIIFLYIISIVFSFFTLKYSGNTQLKLIDELASPTEKYKIVTKREVSGSAVGQTHVYIEKNYFNLIKKSEIKHSTSFTGIPVLTWINEYEYKIGHKTFNVND
jgi:hypothetical protein